jgi:hypothetical protein
MLVFVGCSNSQNANVQSDTSGGTHQMSKQVYRFQINFDSGSSIIKNKYMSQIKEFANYLQSNPNYTTTINGHTDSDGDEASNLQLSQERANAVKSSLVQEGVSETRITAVGYGEKNPIAKNNSTEGKFQNRRVEAQITSSMSKTYLNPGVVEGTVIDAISKKPLGGVSIKVYSNNKLITFLTTDSYGKYRLKLDAGNYVLNFVRTNYLLADINIVVIAKETTTIMQLNQISMEYMGKGTAGGLIVNAFNGKGVPNLRLVVRKGWNNKNGASVNILKTNASGNYVLNVPSGYYTIEASKKGYSTVYFNVTVVGKHKLMTQNGNITPQINKGQIRIILSWNKLPLDMDAHLYTPRINNGSYHVYFKQAGSRRRAPYVDLDLDDRHSYGPETITIYRSFPGRYTYSVRNYSKKPDIKTSGARVQIYGSTGLIKEYHIPSSGGTQLWNVFSYDGGTGKISTINRVSN